MAMKEWIKTASQRIREAVEQALPAPQQPERVPVRIPVPINPPRPHRRDYEVQNRQAAKDAKKQEEKTGTILLRVSWRLGGSILRILQLTLEPPHQSAHREIVEPDAIGVHQRVRERVEIDGDRRRVGESGRGRRRVFEPA
jgi:hypothetical protein